MNLDDPRLTAHAIGELVGADRAEVETFLATSPEARELVMSIRQTASQLTTALATEQTVGLGADRLADLLSTADLHPLRLGRDDVYHVITHPTPEPRRFRTGLLAVAAALTIVITTLAILVSVLFRDRTHGPRQVVAGGQQNARPSGDASADFELASPHGLLELLPEYGDPSRSSGPTLTLNPPPASATRDARVGDYALAVENPFRDATRNPVSTFPFQSRSDSYETVKQQIAAGQRPAPSSIRVEELINAFTYGYAAPLDANAFATYTEVASCPWQPAHRLVRIGLRAREDADPQATVADDVHVSVEFNPQKVTAYRLIGYDRRLSTRAAGVGLAHSVQSGQALTALYEVIPAAHPQPTTLKYQEPAPAARSAELLTLNLRYNTALEKYRVQQYAVLDDARSYQDATGEFRFAAAVASFGLILTDSPHKGASSYDQIVTLAQSAKGLDLQGDRTSFLELVHRTRTLQ